MSASASGSLLSASTTTRASARNARATSANARAALRASTSTNPPRGAVRATALRPPRNRAGETSTASTSSSSAKNTAAERQHLRIRLDASNRRRRGDVDVHGRRAPPPPAAVPETVASLVGDNIPAVIQSPAGLTFTQTAVYSACFAIGLMVLVGSLRPALVVLHNAWYGMWGGEVRKPFTESFYGWAYKILRTALLMVALAWTYIVIVPMSSGGAHLMFPPERCVRLLRIVFYGFAIDSFRKRYLARMAGQLRQRIYGKIEPVDLIPAHVYDRETGVLVWGLTFLAALDSLGLPLNLVLKGLGASTVVLGILASVVLRDTVANYFGGLIVIASGWFSPKEVVRVLVQRREISGRVEHIGLMYTKLINRAGKVAYIPNSQMVAHKVENLSRAPYREFREQLAIPFKDLGHVPDIQERIEAFLRSTAGADVMRGVSLAPRCTLTGINSFAGGAVLEVVCYNDYRSLRQAGYTTMRLRHHIFLGIAEIFESLGVDFAIAGNGAMNTGGPQNLEDNGLEGWDSTAQAGQGRKDDAMGDLLDDRAAVGLYAKTPWL